MDRNKLILTILYVVLIAVFAYFAWTTKLFGLVKSNNSNTGDWQAVFLTNGQVYFGKLSGTNGSWVTLKNIYYLQVQQQVQPTTGDTATQAADANNLTLVKLGNELHGPVDEMSINHDQILFWENMKNDGKVVQAINKYITEGPSAATTPSASPSATK